MPERINRIRIQPAEAGRSLLELVAARFTYRSRAAWQEEIKAGRFRLNDRAPTAETLLAAGDLLVYQTPPLAEPPANFDYTVLYDDGDLLAVNKPAPLACHPGGRYFRHTLWMRLREEGVIQEPLFVNRLDRETSGVVLLAKNREALQCCQRQFAEQAVEKRYLVLVEGDFPVGGLEAAGRLGPDPASLIRKKARFYPEGEPGPTGAKPCCTSFRRLAFEQGLSLLEARPRTGRCHQIRATLFSLGYPVVGDKLYGVDERFFLRLLDDTLSNADRARLRLDCQALHAMSLRCRHPATGRELLFAAPLPPALLEYLPAKTALALPSR